MSYKLSAVSVAVISVFLAGAAGAAGMGPQPGSMFEPSTVRMGGVEVTPWLGLTQGINDNVGSANVKSSSNFTMLNPNVVVSLPTRGQLYSAKYSGAITRFSASSIDNYSDHSLGLIADNVWSGRMKSLVNLDYIKGHDGRNARMFANKEVWHTTGLNGVAHYGAEGAQGQFEAEAGVIAKRYDSNNGGATQNFDYDRSNLRGAFFYKVAPATQMFVEASNAKFAYVAAVSKPFDSNEQRYMVGVKWDATAKTMGSFKLGTMKKSFNQGVNAARTATVWDADINWTPKTYSRFDASLSQTAFESGGASASSFVISQNSQLKWTHDWTGYITSAVSMEDGVDTFQASTRVDKRQSYGLKATYGFKPWLRAGLEYKNTKRNSSITVWTYNQAITMFTLEGSL